MIMLATDGLKTYPGYERRWVPLYLTDDYKVLEGPSFWIMHLVTHKTGSDPTLRQYASILMRFLTWLDEHSCGAKNWQFVDESVVTRYANHLRINQTRKTVPDNWTLEYYIARIAEFYKWADRNGYKHNWKLIGNAATKVLHHVTFLNAPVVVQQHNVSLAHGKRTDSPNKEMLKIADNSTFKSWMSILAEDDIVYAFIAYVFRVTALRPKELLQLPFRGTDKNLALRPYNAKEAQTLNDIAFTFRSKGKVRSIDLPALLWTVICLSWMPERQKRATLYERTNGVSPRNSVLFLSKNGTPITYKMIYHHFVSASKNGNLGRNITPVTLRRSWATHFVLKLLKQQEMLGRGYIYDAVNDDLLRRNMGHEDARTTYKYYVRLANLFTKDDLIYDLARAENNEILEAAGWQFAGDGPNYVI